MFATEWHGLIWVALTAGCACIGWRAGGVVMDVVGNVLASAGSGFRRGQGKT